VSNKYYQLKNKILLRKGEKDNKRKKIAENGKNAISRENFRLKTAFFNFSA
jgi:hypothetical protein